VEVIQEIEEGANGETVYRRSRMSLTGGANIDDFGNRLSPCSDIGDNSPTERKVDFLRVPIHTGEPIVDPLSDYRPHEVFERTYYMTREMDKDKEKKKEKEVENDKEKDKSVEKEKEVEKEDCMPTEKLVHTCNLQVPGFVVTPNSQNVYTSASITIIDTDAQTTTVRVPSFEEIYLHDDHLTLFDRYRNSPLPTTWVARLAMFFRRLAMRSAAWLPKYSISRTQDKPWVILSR